MTMTKGSWRKNVAEKDFGIDISVYSMVWLDNFMLAVIFYVPSSKNTEIWNWKRWFRNKNETKYWNEKYWMVKVLDIEVCYGI